MVIEMSSQVEINFKWSEKMTLNTAQDGAWLVSMEHQGDDDDIYSVENDEKEDEPPEKIAWYLHKLKVSGLRGTLALQAFSHVCTKYDIRKPRNLVEAQAIFEDGSSSISRVIAVTEPLTVAKKMPLPHKKGYETDNTRFNDPASQRLLLKQRTADTLAHACDSAFSFSQVVKNSVRGSS